MSATSDEPIKMKKTKHNIIISLIALLALGVGIAANSTLNSSKPANNVDARPLPPFSLLDHHGNAFTNEQLQGKWSLVFFGYTHCPDICPSTLQNMAFMEQLLAEEAARKDLQIVFISIDPQRDTVKHLNQYIPYFSKNFIGLTGEQNEINKLTKSIGILSESGPVNKETGHYDVTHSGAIIILNKKGEFLGLMSPPHEPKQMAIDYLTIHASM
ncbi:MAG: SCO family protein [Gammaproteobacteria bacterium]|nr:SCO family protein [Gammaproteobacteria bacterium]